MVLHHRLAAALPLDARVFAIGADDAWRAPAVADGGSDSGRRL